MNCNPQNRSAYLIAKMLGWRELELYGATGSNACAVAEI